MLDVDDELMIEELREIYEKRYQQEELTLSSAFAYIVVWIVIFLVLLMFVG